MNNRIIVGYDGSVPAAAAADWAAAEAVARHAELCVLSCYTMPIGGTGPGAALSDRSAPIERARLGGAGAMAVELRRRHPQLSCQALAVIGSPSEVLIDASATADLMVVGRSGAGAVEAFVTGSIANTVARGSSCPTVLVPSCSTRRVSTGIVVVGIDGSPASDAALEWAVAEASLRGGELALVHAWDSTVTGHDLDSCAARDVIRASAAALLESARQAATRRANGYIVRSELVEGHASAALLDVASSADLLVVGSRGRGGLRSVLFGSVARLVADHAPCPTVVIRPASARAVTR